MPREKAAPAYVATYVQQRLAFETDRKRGASAEIARQTGAKTSHVATVRLGKSVPGMGFVAKIAPYWKMTVEELFAAAKRRAPGPWTEEEWQAVTAAAQAGPVSVGRAPAEPGGQPSQAAPERWVEYDPRYPNLHMALRYARGEGRIEPAYLEDMAKTRLNSPVDLPLGIWLRFIELEADARRRAEREWAVAHAAASARPEPTPSDDDDVEGRFAAARAEAKAPKPTP